MREIAALRDQMMESESVTLEESVAPDSPKPQRFTQRWMVWAFLVVAGLGGIAGMSAVSLIRIPNLPNCRAIFWPTASAATRLQCADAYSDQGSVENLLAAIALVEALPDDHPLRPEINERVEQWANQILDIADQTFHSGELDEAIEIARKIPDHTAAADEVSDRVALWREVWDQADSIFKAAEGHLKASRFREAFAAAIQLRSVENEYWSTTRYEELVDLITQTREEVNLLANAERLAQGGDVEAILESLKQIASIAPESYVYEEAQRAMKRLSRLMLDRAEAALLRQNSAEALKILDQIPPEAKLGAEIADFRTLLDAHELTWAGTTVGYEAAIVRLQSISSDRPLYDKAQDLIQQWQGQLEAVAKLNWAKRVAQPGTVADLRAAIAEAEAVGSGTAFWDEAQAQIQTWRDAIAEIEDRPFLDRAKIIASQGDRASLQAAIAEAENIPGGSALYDEAQDEIADWRWRVQKMDNEPLLRQARQLARSGQVDQAIAVASQIPADQAFYEEAQAEIADWQEEQQGNQAYQQALLTAQSGTVDGLVEAISLAQSVPQTSADWAPAQRAANDWSWSILDRANAIASQDLGEAIAIAGRVPPKTDAYAEAQLRIRDWQTAILGTP